MALYELEFNGKKLELEANSPEQAATAARLYFAGRGRAEDIEASRGAEAKTLEAQTPFAAAQRATAAMMTDPEALGAGFLGATGPAAAAGTLGAATVLADPVGVGKAALLGFGGSVLGRGAGKTLEGLGAPEGTSNITGLLGGLAGPVGGPALLSKLVSLGGAGSRGGLISNVLSRFGGPAKAAPAVTDVVKQAQAARITAQIAQDAEKHAAAMERHALQQEVLKKRLSGELPTRNPKGASLPRSKASSAEPATNPDATMPPTPATEVSPPRVLPKGQGAMATNLGGKAKPGPPATPPDELTAALESSLRAPRIQVGAQKVGRSVGMTKEQVRMEAGPVLDEIRGLASPILPKKALQSIVDKMRSIPMEQREAYVQAATSGKAKWQVENIRRTLEHLGLLIPAGAVAGAALEQ